MTDFFAELKRRHIYRVGAAYVVVAWAITQVIDVLSQIFDLPGSISRPAIILLAVGFPVALIAAWMIECKPHAAVASAVRSKPTIVDWTLCGALAVVIVLIGYQQIAPSDATTRQGGVNAARQAAASPATAVSLAVLPFANLSGDASQEFFSDGITEEITAALARVADLRVVARTSAYQFRDQNRDIQSIGQQLRATHFIEGSVRKAGDRVRITAQLINASDGTHIWAENYDRQLTDIFAIQEDIARAIAGSLRMSLGLRAGEQLVANRDIDPDSYQQYLRARAVLLRGRNRAGDVIAILEPLVARNPNYAPAWEALAFSYFFTVTVRGDISTPEGREARETYVAKTEAAARRALALDPNSVYGLFFESAFRTGPRKWAQIEDAMSKALTLDPNHPEGLNHYSGLLLTFGRFKEAVRMKLKLRELEPFVPIYDGNLAEALWLDGQNDAAIAVLKENLGRQGAGAGQDLPRVYASLGRYQEAADVLSQFGGQGVRSLLSTAVPLLRSAPSKVSAPEGLPPLGRLGWIYLYIGAPEKALEFYEQGAPDILDIAYLWHPTYAPVRKLERFKVFLRQQGLIEYWRERGWPDVCRPVGADDFECE
jgi:adenylate cyclase